MTSKIPPPSPEYDISAIRNLLQDAFTAKDLWRFCQVRPEFRSAMADFGFNPALAEMVDVLLEYCRTKLLFADLLSGIKELNPNQYKRYHDQLLISAGSAAATRSIELPPIYHNLPNPDYVRFVGREEELARVHELLSPANRAWVVTIDGIGGIGKSALALEVAHRYLRDYDQLPPEDRFQAMIWTSAKAAVLTADGIAPRQQVTRTLDDIYTTIAVTLEREDITRTRPEEQDEIVTKALTRQRTLLIVDNSNPLPTRKPPLGSRQRPARQDEHLRVRGAYRMMGCSDLKREKGTHSYASHL